MMELQNKFSGLEQRESGDLIINTFIFVLLIFLLLIIDHSVENFFSFFPKSLRLLFCHYFYFIACFLNQYPSTSGKRVMDLEAGFLSVGLAL